MAVPPTPANGLSICLAVSFKSSMVSDDLMIDSRTWLTWTESIFFCMEITVLNSGFRA